VVAVVATAASPSGQRLMPPKHLVRWLRSCGAGGSNPAQVARESGSMKVGCFVDALDWQRSQTLRWLGPATERARLWIHLACDALEAHKHDALGNFVHENELDVQCEPAAQLFSLQLIEFTWRRRHQWPAELAGVRFRDVRWRRIRRIKWATRGGGWRGSQPGAGAAACNWQADSLSEPLTPTTGARSATALPDCAFT
jgi:hypothetical protein